MRSSWWTESFNWVPTHVSLGKKGQILQSQTQQVSCSWTCSFEWSCKIAKKNPPTLPSRCALQRIRITFGKLPRWFAISWNWNRWERPVWFDWSFFYWDFWRESMVIFGIEKPQFKLETIHSVNFFVVTKKSSFVCAYALWYVGRFGKQSVGVAFWSSEAIPFSVCGLQERLPRPCGMKKPMFDVSKFASLLFKYISERLAREWWNWSFWV